jgi:hypothetical protein
VQRLRRCGQKQSFCTPKQKLFTDETVMATSRRNPPNKTAGNRAGKDNENQPGIDVPA